MEEIKESTMKMNYSVQDSKELMNYLVKDALAEWQIFNVDLESEGYVNEKAQKDCIRFINKKIIENMTDTVKFQLSIGFNMDTAEEQVKSITSVAKIHVLEYTIKQNTSSGEEAIQNINAF